MPDLEEGERGAAMAYITAAQEPLRKIWQEREAQLTATEGGSPP